MDYDTLQPILIGAVCYLIGHFIGYWRGYNKGGEYVLNRIEQIQNWAGK